MAHVILKEQSHEIFCTLIGSGSEIKNYGSGSSFASCK